MKKGTLFFINIVLFIILAVLLVISLKGTRQPAKTHTPKPLPAEILHKETLYSIPEIAHGETAAQKGRPKDLSDVYAAYPEADAGDNMMTTWSSVKPEDKEKLTHVIDKSIADTKEALKANPEDKKLKSKLFISETMKNLVSNGFNYKFKQND